MIENATQSTGNAEPIGLLAQYNDVDTFLFAVEVVRKAGYTRWESYTPFPVHRLDEAMGLKPTRLPYIALMLGLAGLVGGLALVWWTNAVAMPVPTWLQGYTFIISGKPFFSLPANIPVIFETTVLLAAFGAVFGMLALNGLPALYNPLFKRARFARASADRFFIAVEAKDERYDADRTAELLSSSGASVVEVIEE